MAEHSYTSRAELDQYHFSVLVAALVPLVALVLQVTLPKALPRVAIFDLPLIVTFYFAVARRSPVKGAVTGTIIGLAQDGLAGHPFGIFGMTKAILGYAAASIGFAIDVENVLSRTVLNFVGCFAQSVLVWLITRFLLADHTVRLLVVHELIRAGITTGLSVPLFYLLDSFRVRD